MRCWVGSSFSFCKNSTNIGISAALEFVLDIQIGLDIEKAVILSSFNYDSWRSEVMRVRSTMQTVCPSWGAELPIWRDGWKQFIHVSGMWNCTQAKHLVFQVYSKLVFQLLVKISPVWVLGALWRLGLILSVLCLEVVIPEVTNCPYKMGWFKPAIYI